MPKAKLRHVAINCEDLEGEAQFMKDAFELEEVGRAGDVTKSGAIYLSDLQPVSSFAHGGLIRDTDLALVSEVQVGDFVIAHVGFAIAVLDRRAAEEALALWDRAAELEKGSP